MMYVSLCEWRDLQDGHLYQAGEPFPHDGRQIAAERIEMLINGKNRASKPLVKEVRETPTADAETPQKPKRTRKTKQ